MASLVNNCVFLASASGAGAFGVASAAQGYQTPAQRAEYADAKTYRYRAQSLDLSQWEEGNTVGSSTGTSFTRVVSASSAGGTTTVSFSAAPNVILTMTAADVLQFDDAMTLTAAQRAQARSNISAILRGQIAGLTLSTAGASATFSIAAGEAADSTAADLMVLGSNYTKTTGAWVVGSGNGGLDTGAITSGWCHIYEIKRPDTGVVDICYSASATAPTVGSSIPAAYTLFRRIGSLLMDGSSHWTKFIQKGDEFLWDAPVQDAAVTTTLTMTPLAITLSVPTNVVVNALFQADFTNNGIVQGICLLYSPATATQAAGTPAGNWSLTNPAVSVFCSNPFSIRTNASAQINAVAGQASNNSLFIITSGWIDTRGRLS